MRSSGCVLLTAISAISSERRPARRAAAAMRSFRTAMFSAMDIKSLTTEGTEDTEEFFTTSVSSVVHNLHHRGGWRWFIRVARARQREEDHQTGEQSHHHNSAQIQWMLEDLC